MEDHQPQPPEHEEKKMNEIQLTSLLPVEDHGIGTNSTPEAEEEEEGEEEEEDDENEVVGSSSPTPKKKNRFVFEHVWKTGGTELCKLARAYV